MEMNEIIACACANRAFVYQYLWRLFADVPDEDALRALDGEAAQQLSLFFGDDASALEEHAAMKRAAANGAQELSGEYTKLFIGPGALAAPPWESVYVCGEDLVFQQSTLDVRNAYRAAGFEAAGYPRIPDDHIATELAFMAALCTQASDAAQTDDMDAVRVSLGRQAMFLAEHLGAWVGKFASRLAGNLPKSAGPFYVCAANLAREAVAADAGLISELLESCAS